MNFKIIALASVAALTLAACEESTPDTAEQRAAAQQETISTRAQEEVGIYNPTHFTRKRLANRIGQMLDDPALATISYAQGIDGRLRCIGNTIGFPMPGGTQTTAPTKWGTPPNRYQGYQDVQVPQSEPDQLYYPSASNGTWLLMVTKAGGSEPVYFEGNVETFLADAKPDASLIAQDCS